MSPVWDELPARFNFARDVVESADPSRLALRFVDAGGGVSELTFGELAARADSWAALLRRRGLGRGDRLLVLVGKTPSGTRSCSARSSSERSRSPARSCCARATSPSARATPARACSSRGAAPRRRRRARRAGRRGLDGHGRPARGARDDRGHDRRRARLHPLHVGHDEGPEGRRPHARATLREALQAERWLDARPTTSSGAPPARAGRSRSGTCCSARGARGAGSCCTRAPSTPRERFELLAELGRDRPLPGADRVPPDGEARRPRRLRPPPGPPRRVGRRAAEPRGDQGLPRRVRALVHDGYGQTENTLLVGNFPGTEIRPGSMGLPSPGPRRGDDRRRRRELPPGQEGDIALRGRPPSLFAEYYARRTRPPPSSAATGT